MNNFYTYKKEGKDPLFTFETQYGLFYYVSFKGMNIDLINLKFLYSIDFGELDNKKFIKDDKIENTIIAIILYFFSTVPNAVLHFVCDSMDNKQNYRSKLFDKWFTKTNKTLFSKLAITYFVPNEEISYKLEFIFNEKFHDFENLKETVINQLEEYSNLK